MAFDTSRLFRGIASNTGVGALGGISAQNLRNETAMGNAYLRAQGRIKNAEIGVNSINRQADDRVSAINDGAWKNMWGQLGSGLVSGVIGGIGNMGGRQNDLGAGAAGTDGFGPWADGGTYGRYLDSTRGMTGIGPVADGGVYGHFLNGQKKGAFSWN